MKDRVGIPELRKEINLVLLHQIKYSIPKCRENIIELLSMKEIEFK